MRMSSTPPRLPSFSLLPHMLRGLRGSQNPCACINNTEEAHQFRGVEYVMAGGRFWLQKSSFCRDSQSVPCLPIWPLLTRCAGERSSGKRENWVALESPVFAQSISPVKTRAAFFDLSAASFLAPVWTHLAETVCSPRPSFLLVRTDDGARNKGPRKQRAMSDAII